MKTRKSLIVFLIAVLMLATAIIYFDTKLLDHVKQTTKQQENTEEAGEENPEPSMQEPAVENDEESQEDVPEDAAGTDTADAETDDDLLIASESVPVSYNTPEYDIEVELCENKDMKTFIRLKYYRDGASVGNEIDEEQIPELAGIFESRNEAGGGDGTQQNDAEEQGTTSEEDRPYSIGQALLNPVHGQLYLMVNGARTDQYIQSSFYLVDLNDLSVKKLFSYPAKYGRMYFNRDFSMLAYSFSDPPKMKVYQEDSILEIFDCANSEFVVRGSRRDGDSVIGKNSAPGYIYDYIFISWHAPGVVRLTRDARPADDSGAEPVRSELLYDVETDLLLNLDGTELSMEDNGESADGQGTEEKGTGDTGGPGTEEGQPDESGPAAQLRLFYKYLGSTDEYPKAMLMLDDNFVLRMGMLAQFGVSEIHKSDIDAQEGNVALYAELLRATKFDSLVSVRMPDENTAVVSYMHSIGLAPDSQLSQLMTARMAKKGESWVITLIEDGSQ